MTRARADGIPFIPIQPCAIGQRLGATRSVPVLSSVFFNIIYYTKDKKLRRIKSANTKFLINKLPQFTWKTSLWISKITWLWKTVHFYYKKIHMSLFKVLRYQYFKTLFVYTSDINVLELENNFFPVDLFVMTMTSSAGTSSLCFLFIANLIVTVTQVFLLKMPSSWRKSWVNYLTVLQTGEIFDEILLITSSEDVSRVLVRSDVLT